MTRLETDVVVVGTGPTGGVAALALAKQGVRVMAINRYGWTCRTPRAHITNARTMEVLADLGVMEGVKAYSTSNDLIGEAVLCRTLAGEEYGRVRTFGTHPERRAMYAAASPECIADLPQNYLENILLGAAAHNGATVLLQTEFLRFEQDGDGVTSYYVNRLTQNEFSIRSKYLIGADGANSKVAEQANLPFAGEKAKAGAATNILFDADLTHLVAHRPSALYWTLQDAYSGGYPTVLRMIRPWNRWIAHAPWDMNVDPSELNEARAKKIVYDLLGDDSVDVKIDSLSIWTVNEQWATRIQEGRVFCAGDAVHRHPPLRGLGSNTCMQDAYNLAWKLAHVIKGWAAPSLLQTYNDERVPIAEQVVKAAFGAYEFFVPTVGALTEASKLAPSDQHLPKEVFHDGKPESTALRTKLRESIVASHRMYDMPGLEMNQRYKSQAAVAPAGEAMPAFKLDEDLHYQPTTFPGARMPHGWVFKNGRKESLLYLCGKGRFTLLTGNSGQEWRDAAGRVERELGVPVQCVAIGPGQDYEDSYGDYAGLSELEEDGAILVRPDMHVAWRAKRWTEAGGADLKSAMAKILGRDMGNDGSAPSDSARVECEKFDEIQLVDLR